MDLTADFALHPPCASWTAQLRAREPGSLAGLVVEVLHQRELSTWVMIDCVFGFASGIT